MIRKLNKNDRETVLDFLGDEPSINLFIIGDIENFGFESDFQDIWGQYDGDTLIGVLLRYNDNFIPYYKNNNSNDSDFKEIIKKHDGNTMISGKGSIIEKYLNLLENKKTKRMYFCELTDDALLKSNYDNVKTADISDAERINEMMITIEEFNRISNVKDFKNRIENKSGRVYFSENMGEIITVSQTTAENSKSAMVVGVATAKKYRNQGLMSACLSKLCKDVLDEGKTLCLFYDNPKAGSVYHKLGFKSIDKWIMIH